MDNNVCTTSINIISDNYAPNKKMQIKLYALRYRLLISCHYVTYVMGVAYKNLTVKSDVSRMPLSKSGFDLERGAFCADLKKNDVK